MKKDVDNSALLTRYLLGELSEVEEVSVERRFFEDSDFLDELRSTERDLVDCYVRGEMTGKSVKRFEHRFLTEPERKSRVLFANVFARSIDRRQDRVKGAAALRIKESRSWRSYVSGRAREFLTAAAVLASAVSTIFLLWTVTWWQASAPNVVTQQPAATETDPTPPVGPTVTQTEEPKPRASMPALILRPGRLRGEGGIRLVIPAGVKVVPLVIQLRPNDYVDYRVVLQTSDGGTLWQSGHLKADRRRRVSVGIPVGFFGNREYSVVVNGRNQNGQEDDVDDYYFEVVRQ